MRYKNTRLKIILLLCFVFTNMLIFAMTEINKRQRVNLAINANTQDLQTQFDVINRFQEGFAGKLTIEWRKESIPEWIDKINKYLTERINNGKDSKSD